jgi:hypothetical protein
LYLVFLAIGFAGGMLASQVLWGKRLEQRVAELAKPAVEKPEPAPVAVNVNVSEELVARYLATFNLVAIPREVLQGLEGFRQTRH